MDSDVRNLINAIKIDLADIDKRVAELEEYAKPEEYVKPIRCSGNMKRTYG